MEENKFKDQPFFIRKVIINDFMSGADINWMLDDVNILTGKNGTGKSTVLKLIGEALEQPEIDKNKSEMLRLKGKFSKVRVEFNNGMFANMQELQSKDQFLGLIIEELQNDFVMNGKNKDERFFDELREKVKNRMSELSDVSGEDYYSVANQFGPFEDKEDTIYNYVNVEYISTFDMILMSKKEYDKYSDSVYTQLDIEIEKQIRRLTSRLLSISRNITSEYEGNNNKKSISAIGSHRYESVNKFKKELNKFFNFGDKIFDINDDGSIKVSCKGDEIELRDLSSGEKQLILILLKVINSSDKPTIMIMDEPEVSLHLDWQEKLIGSIKRINPNSQVILASHSPGVLMNGWFDKAVDINSLKKLVVEV